MKMTLYGMHSSVAGIPDYHWWVKNVDGKAVVSCDVEVTPAWREYMLHFLHQYCESPAIDMPDGSTYPLNVLSRTELHNDK